MDRAEPEVTAKADLRCLHTGAKPDTVSTSMAPLGVLVIDDSPVPRFAARAMLGATKSFRCVGEASSGPEGIAACQRLRPQVVLMDVDMPQMDGAQTTKSILEVVDPRPIIVAWTVSDSGDDLIRMIHAGCDGYALKDFGPAELERSLLAAVKGETPVPRKMVREVIAKAVSGPRAPGTEVEDLTAREREVLHLVARGSATKEVAAELGISRRSVDAHLRSIYRKLDATNRVQAVNRARTYGLIPFEQFEAD